METYLRVNTPSWLLKRFVADLENEEWEWTFDARQAARYLNFIERVCVHTRGDMAGKKFLLEPWQVFFVGQIFRVGEQD